MNYFFIYQNKSYQEEQAGGYIKALKKNAIGRDVSHWANVAKVRKGDVILHCHKQRIVAISQSMRDAYEEIQLVDPMKYGYQEREGWKVDVEYHKIEAPINIVDLKKEILNIQTDKHAILDKYGKSKEGYLFIINEQIYQFLLNKILKEQKNYYLHSFFNKINSKDMLYNNEFNIPEIRLIPMNKDEFSGMTIHKIQEKFFLNKLVNRQNCSYYYKHSGLNSFNNSLLLFQIDAKIIAAARLDNVVEGNKETKYSGSYRLYPESITVFAPITLQDIQSICPEFSGFTRAKQFINIDYISAVLKLIEIKSKNYKLSEVAKEISNRTAEKEAIDISISELIKRDNNNRISKNKNCIKTIVYYRNPYLKELVKRIAGGNCQLCGKVAPFTDSNGKPYLEEHHIKKLADGGEDVINNVVALCPNCHRKVHISIEESDVMELKKIVKRNEEKYIQYNS